MAKKEAGRRPASIFYLQNKDCSVRPATERELYEYTTKRWLYNERYELSRRLARFNVFGLMQEATKAASQGATRCVRVMKYQEGEHNKVFLLTMDNGVDVIGKIPNFNAGPAYYTTASEVATMTYLRESLQIPVPKVLAWSANLANSVQSEFIIMEQAQGVVLRDCWSSLEQPAKTEIISQIVHVQQSLASTSFPVHGCLFFKNDIAATERSEHDLPSNLSQKYTLGPSVDSILWEDGRDELTVHRGPWTTLQSYATDLGKNELDWVKTHALPRMNYCRDVTAPEQPSEAASLLTNYLLVAPYISMVKDETKHLETRTLSHRDLNSSNVFVDPRTNKITAIIDWQGSAVAPLALQAEIPRMVRHFPPLQPGLPERSNHDNSTHVAGTDAADPEQESIHDQKFYEELIAEKIPSLYSAILHNNNSISPPIAELMQIVCGSWKNREIWKLRASLINIAENWESLGTSEVQCPVQFTADDLSKHDEELNNLSYLEDIMEVYENQGILPADGRVDPEDFEAFEMVNRQQKEAYVSLSDDPTDRRLRGDTWPWQDWPERVPRSP